ncbi:MAG: carboxypeptidase-like regulatory domain-containing protein [Muribaculaceae bacterium]|nr:carboxypeptidase-like regulatory domain-containing protein [Muribaculaceae bacterium]
MRRGKETCRILKEIRRQIADANDIEYITSECRFQGDCLGTCPKCEAEVQYLEQQLSARHAAGKAIALAGISAGLIISSCTSCSIIGGNKYKADGEVGYHEASTQNIISTPNDTITHGKLTITPLITESNAETVNISGCIRDLRDNELLIGVSIIEKGTNNGTDSNFDGNFSLKAKKGSTIELHYVGCKPLQFIANSNCTIQAFLEWDDRTLDDPIIIAGVVPQ